MTFKLGYGLGFGVALGLVLGTGIVDAIRAKRTFAQETEAEPLVIEVRPELWTAPDYEASRVWAREGGDV